MGCPQLPGAPGSEQTPTATLCPCSMSSKDGGIYTCIFLPETAGRADFNVPGELSLICLPWRGGDRGVGRGQNRSSGCLPSYSAFLKGSPR